MTANPTYREELDRLAATYDAATATAAAPLPPVPAAFVASGGSLAVAHAGAALHHRTGRGVAYVATPHELVSAGATPPLVVVVSDQLGHPDAHSAIRHGLAAGAEVVVVTTRAEAEVAEGARVVTCPRPGRDGYVATSSVLAMTVGLLRAYAPERRLPPFESLAGPWLDAGSLRADRLVHAADVVCAYAPALRHVAVDIETRHGESGLGHVTIVDLRGLGHGRHVALARNAGRAAALLVCDDESASLAARTADALAPGIERVVWQATQPWPVVVAEMLLPSFGLLGARSAGQGVDPGNPPVTAAGERLFRLGLDGLAEVET